MRGSDQLAGNTEPKAPADASVKLEGKMAEFVDWIEGISVLELSQLVKALEARLGESFRLVSERLEQVHKGLGEMQTLAAGVGDLKKVLTNVKTRGTWGMTSKMNSISFSAEEAANTLAVLSRHPVDGLAAWESLLLTGGETAAQLRDMIISSLQRAKLFVLTENPERADAVLKGSAEDLVFTDTFQSSEGISARASAGTPGSATSSGSAATIRPTEFEPGKIFGSGKMKPIDYMLALAEGRIPPPSNLDLATVQHQAPQTAFRFHINQYLSRRAADWKAKGFTEMLIDFTELNKRSKFWGDDQRASWLNWDEVADLRNPLGERQNITERIMLRELLRRVDMMVMLENQLDVLVRLHTPWPPGKIGGAGQGFRNNLTMESLSGPNAGLTEVLIPAGFVTTVYDPVYQLSADGKSYLHVPSNKATTIPEPGLPFSLVFRAEPGKEDILLQVAASYEAASRRRIPPPAFGPLPVEQRARSD